MSDPLRALDQTAEAEHDDIWTTRLIWFVRVMAGISMLKGLYHWAVLCGVGDGPYSMFEVGPMPWRAATVFFAVIDLVAAVGLWLAAAWGGVVWLTAAISMAAVELLFPDIYGGRSWVIFLELAAIATYLGLTVLSARERAES
jgi:hypothetical protein